MASGNTIRNVTLFMFQTVPSFHSLSPCSNVAVNLVPWPDSLLVRATNDRGLRTTRVFGLGGFCFHTYWHKGVSPARTPDQKLSKIVTLLPALRQTNRRGICASRSLELEQACLLTLCSVCVCRDVGSYCLSLWQT